jgi:heme-degrading monooxygenase HmoA
MVITVTSIKLRSPWKFFRLSMFGYKVQKQIKGEKGFIKLKNTGFGKDHYTLSAWQSVEDLKRFSKSGAHAVAMKSSKELSTEIRIYTYTADSIPDWKEAKSLLLEHGKVLNFK